ncbi:hypothetical protein [Legionella gresilensis]|uniref:hypothetical protein n=1 Tax=Legionella gresilensis TaxID=91823 RepID=UPI001040F1BC|nr:hypothetical protein [Legionella gresilensis]
MPNVIKIIYGVNPKTQTLIIKGVHNQFEMNQSKIRFALGGKNSHYSEFTIELDSAMDMGTRKEIVYRELKDKFQEISKEIADDQNYPEIKEIQYQGDVNLGFDGSHFPECLLDSTIHEVFKQNKFYNRTQINVTLESATDAVVLDAKDEIQKYAKHHEVTYPGSPVMLKSKGRGLSFTTDEIVKNLAESDGSATKDSVESDSSETKNLNEGPQKTSTNRYAFSAPSASTGIDALAEDMSKASMADGASPN